MRAEVNYSNGIIWRLLFVGALFWTGAAFGNPCEDLNSGLMTGPVELSFQDGDFMSPRHICPSTRLNVGGGAQLTLEPEKYGLEPVIQVASGSSIDVRAQSRISGSYALGEGLEVFASIEPVVYRLLISAYQASHLGLGNSSLGATLHLHQTKHFVLALSNRANLPTAYGLYQNAWPVSLDTSFLFLFAPWSALHFHGQAGTVFSYPFTQGLMAPRAGLLAVAGFELFLFDWVSLVSDLQGLSLYGADLDHLAYAGALRYRIWRFGVETAILAPFAGVDRNLLRAELRLSYRFDD